MKINSITNTGYQRARMQEYSVCRGRECEKDNSKAIKDNNQINTTIKSNSDGRVCFKGNVPLLHKMANYVTDNPLTAEALFAILITCFLRPVSIMATAKTDEDKDKCTYQAAKSISSGLIGLALTACVGTPIAAGTKAANTKGAFEMPAEMKEKSTAVVSKGVEALKNLGSQLAEKGEKAELTEQIKKLTEGGMINLNVLQKAGKKGEKLFKSEIDNVAPNISETVKSALKEQKIINNYAKTGKNVADKMFQPVFMPIRATITIAMVPLIIKLLGIKKSSNDKKQEEQKCFNTLNYSVFQTSNEKDLFNPFLEVADHENK